MTSSDKARSLASEIREFLGKHAKPAANLEEEEKYNSPDAHELERAAEILDEGASPVLPNSSWESGGYYPYTDKEARIWHDNLLTRIKELLKEKTASWITFSLGLWETPNSHKVAISLPELVKETNAFSHQYEGGCIATLQDSKPKELFLRYNVKCSKPDSDPAGHDVRVHFDVKKLFEAAANGEDIKGMARNLDVRVSCSCPAFLWWAAQWNLHKKDGLEGEPRPKLQAPKERLDLRNNFVVCKHIYVVFKRILPSVQHNIVKILRELEIEKHREDLKKPYTPDLEDKMEKSRLRQQIRKLKNKRLQQRMLDALRKEEEEKMESPEEEPAWMRLPEKYKNIDVERSEPAEEEPVEEEKENLNPEDRDAMHELLREDLAKRREEHQEKKEEPHLHEGLPYETGREPDMKKTDREILEEKKKKQQSPNEMKEFLKKKLTFKLRKSERNLLDLL